MDAYLITDADGKQINIKDIIKTTIKALEPEINELNNGDSMDRIIDRINNQETYYNSQLSLYSKNKNFNDILLENIKCLKS